MQYVTFLISITMPSLPLILSLFVTASLCQEPMTKEERHQLREEARDMFYHAYNAYMENAYPADELMPLSCAGRYRGRTPNRGDIDDCLGNFSLTLIDTLDTLVVLGDLEEFEHAVKLIINDVSFDNDVVVSVFETNIRVVGGLLSAHILADYLQQRDGIMPWYKGELLSMAKDVGYRLMPAFNTTTGIPYSRVNLKYGIKSDRLEALRETCTACAGSMILEMAALSRLTGEPVFETKAHKAMDELWKMRHRSSDLMGTVLNVHSGDWVRRDSGVGAGIDSYYEYCLKAYILLGEDRYLNRFNRHYNAVMKYISQGPMLLDVHMHRPHTNSRNYMDALLAFWPGLQVLKGDIKPAVETHEMLYQVMRRHKFIPEAFTTDFQVHWGNHPLRPEFLESTYFLYGATNDPYYLEVGRTVLRTLQRYARVPCGYAAVNDVRTAKQEDRMDSFVLSETFKYLFLLFSDKEDLILDLDKFIFTTEGHLLPLSLAGRHINGTRSSHDTEPDDSEFARSCPNTLQLFPESVRKPLQNMVDGVCPKKRRRLTAAEFSAANVNHLKTLKDMGINIIALNDGRVQLLHTFSAARSAADAEEGMMFMHEMVELSKLQSRPTETTPQIVSFPIQTPTGEQTVSVQAGPSHFGKSLKQDELVKARAVIVSPIRGCKDIEQGDALKGKIAIMERGDCMFVDKVRAVEKFGAVAAIIIDNVPGTSAISSPLFSMSGDGRNDVKIPSVFLFTQDASKLRLALAKDPSIEVTIKEMKGESDLWTQNEEESMFQKLKVSVQEFLNKHTGIDFSKAVEVGNFVANIGNDKIRITYNEKTKEPAKIPVEETANYQWSQIRKGLLKSIIHSSTKELYVPVNILRIYYQTLSGASIEELKALDVVKQTEWLLKELLIEHQKTDDDALVKLEEDSGVSIFADLKQLSELENAKENNNNLETLSSLLESVSNVMSPSYSNVINNLDGESVDDIVVSDSDKNADEDVKKSRAADEL
ncbi:ER degradation-enhancing alpha-mannosidase-like protein 3 [Aethina tumida]|uniref:ER degradation-enhancing alpha-mannosidase-like protein 3 n=1 Tax=Aethina tumida TaxID=116153 RepID=UPI00214920AB|nr:ER degradation-enhancing alpha-mannosidase-like protein 3 [Aethina tumida]